MTSQTSVPLLADPDVVQPSAVPAEPARDDDSCDRLLVRIASGDRAACAELYDRHAAAVFGLLLRLAEDRGRAEELLCETFVAASRRLQAHGRVDTSARAWLLLLARELAVGNGRDGTEGDGGRPGRDLVALTPVELPPALDRLDGSERRRHVEAALAGVPGAERQALDLAFRGVGVGDVARRLGVSREEVGSGISRALRRLRRARSGEGAAASDRQRIAPDDAVPIRHSSTRATAP
jgi:RNA polymerase sigma-70 factor, ECF subfamily